MINDNAEQPYRIPPVIPLLKQENFVATYTVLAVLRKMRKELGIEAMHEYLDAYLQAIEANNSKLKNTVELLLNVIKVEKIYQDCMGRNER